MKGCWFGIQTPDDTHWQTGNWPTVPDSRVSTAEERNLAIAALHLAGDLFWQHIVLPVEAWEIANPQPVRQSRASPTTFASIIQERVLASVEPAEHALYCLRLSVAASRR